MAPSWPKMAARRPKMAPRWRPRCVQDGTSLARPRRSSLDVFHVFVVMFIDFSLIFKMFENRFVAAQRASERSERRERSVEDEPGRVVRNRCRGGTTG